MRKEKERNMYHVIHLHKLHTYCFYTRETFPPSPFYILCLFPSVELQKANLEAQNTQTPGSGTTPGASGASASPSTTTTTASPLASAIPLAQLLSKPGALNALSSLTALGGLTELLGGAAGAAASALPVQTTGVHRSHKFTPRLRSPGAPGPTDSGKFKSERTKYNPYWASDGQQVERREIREIITRIRITHHYYRHNYYQYHYNHNHTHQDHDMYTEHEIYIGEKCVRTPG